jgi:hypothetical protein
MIVGAITGGPNGGRGALASIGIYVGDDYRSAKSSQNLRDLLAHALARAGHDSYPVIQSHQLNHLGAPVVVILSLRPR